MDTKDSVTGVIDQWHQVLPNLDVAPIAILTRVAKIRSIALQRQEEIFKDFDLTPADFVTVVTLRRRHRPFRLSQSELAESLGLTPGTVSVRVDRLLRLGLAIRTRSEADSRVHWVELTELGEQTFNQVAPLHLEAESNLLVGLTHKQRNQLTGLLTHWLSTLESAPNRSDAPQR